MLSPEDDLFDNFNIYDLDIDHLDGYLNIEMDELEFSSDE